MMEGKTRWVWMLLLIAILWWLGFIATTDACWEQERIALLHLKPFFNYGDNLETWIETNDNFNDSSISDCCEWKRVNCNSTSKRVISLSLNYTRHQDYTFYLDEKFYLNDRFYLNVSLFLPFQELKSLYLRGNGILGFIENEEPQPLKLINLEELDLGYNFLKNDTLAFVYTFSRLKSLDMSFNRLEGSIDIRGMLNNLINLRRLDLSGNHIESLQPSQEPQPLKLINLEELDLSGNRLKNDTLAFVYTFSRLKSLAMSYNQLEGSIDIEGLNSLINLRRLDLRLNKIESFKPSQGNNSHLRLTHLEELYLSNNLFNNSVFASLSKLSNLKYYLDINSNRIGGSIDIMKDLGAFTNLEALDMGDNTDLTFTNLEALDMGYNTDLNKFVADKENRSLTKLKYLFLDGAFTNGSIIELVQLLKAFSSVKIFSLQFNHFDGTIPIQDHEMHRNKNVEEIYLDFSYLNNNIFQVFQPFTSLKVLSLMNCQLTGILIDKGWCNLRNLRLLDLSGNALEGMLPLSFGNLTSLRYLSLSNNALQVPVSFSPLTNLSNLKVLLIDENKLVMDPYAGFHTSVPKFQLNIVSLFKCITDQQLMREPPKLLYHQHNLRYVDLSYNNISGSIPVWLLENNTNLESLFLVGNSFTGSLLLPSLPHLSISSIDMSHNKIQGQIPTNTCSAFPNLENLLLSQNEFKSNIPHCLGGMRILTYLDLSNNQLFGELSEELTKSSSLKRLRLSNNKFSGKIPTIFKSSILSHIYLDGNNFVGEITDIDIHSSVSSFEAINLSNNSLFGELPSWIWNLSNLRVLDLSNNHFEGSIPSELCNLEQLRLLDFSQNNLSGAIPSCFRHHFIKFVHLNGNILNGPVSSTFPNSPQLMTLDLSGNNLINGNITEWIGGLFALCVLILRDNQLDGVIPVQLCGLYSLSILDLSRNMFTGPIPTCLGNLTLQPRLEKINSNNSESIHLQPIKVDVSPLFGILYDFDASPIFVTFSAYDVDVFEEVFSVGYNSGRFLTHYSSSDMKESVDFTTKNRLYSYKGDILEYMSGIDLSCNELTDHIPVEIGNLNEIHALNLSHNKLTGGIPSSFSKLKEIESLDLSYNNLSGKIPTQLVELNSLAVFSVAHNNLSGNTPERKAQFGTFEESSYKDNPLLCGPPLHNNCSHTGLERTILESTIDEEDGFLDTYVFCITFLVTYVVVLLVIFIVLFINPYWRQRWFIFIENFIHMCCYSTVGNFFALHVFRRIRWRF